MKPIFFLKSVPRKYSNDFDKGIIHFSKPIEWIREELKGNKGQGDCAEGIYGIINGIHVRRRNILNNYCFCLYVLKDRDFTKKAIDGSGEPGREYLVSKKYFDDFNNYDPNSSVIYMIKPQLFMDKLIDSLIRLGIKRENIYNDFIHYYPIKLLDGNILNISYPLELFAKDVSFIHQSEYRIIIRCDDETIDILQKLNGNIVINEMSECIITKLDSYNTDMLLFLEDDTNALLYSLPKEIVTDISKELEGYSELELAGFEFYYLLAAEPFFYFENWLEKFEETIEKVKEKNGVLFDINIFGLIDIKTNMVVSHMDRNYYYKKLTDKAEFHFNRKHYETAYNLYLEAKYIGQTYELNDKILECQELMEKAQ